MSMQPGNSGSRRLRILLSCYSCGPGRGSEPGVGWNAAVSLAAHHEVHVLTTSEFEMKITELVKSGTLPPSLQFHFYELPLGWLMWRHPNGLFIRIHYLAWQRAAQREVRRLNDRFKFDSAQHLTFVRYWNPSCLANSGIPYIFGPVGGADQSPVQFLKGYSFRGRIFEKIRELARAVAERSKSVRESVCNAVYVLATTEQTVERCVYLGAQRSNVVLCGESALSEMEFSRLATFEMPPPPVCFFGLGRLVHLKGYDMALRAFARAGIPAARFVLIGGGGEAKRLRMLADRLGVGDRVEITGFLKRDDALAKLANMHVLVHPSHHESGGWACIEAMAAGKPVICLDWSGPGIQVSDEAGIKVPVGEEGDVVCAIADAMRRFSDISLVAEKGAAARILVQSRYVWEEKAKFYARLHEAIAAKGESAEEVDAPGY